MTPNTQFLNFIILKFLHFPLGNNVTSMLPLCYLYVTYMLGIMLGIKPCFARLTPLL